MHSSRSRNAGRVQQWTRPLLVAIASMTLSACVYWTPMSHRPSTAANVIPDVPMQKWDIKSCGAGALSAVLRHHGDARTMREWQEVLPKTRGGVMSIDLVLAARQQGFDASLVTGDPQLVEAEVRDGRPVILMLKVVGAPGKSFDFFHYIVIDGHDPQRNTFRTQFGDGRARWTTMERLEPAWKSTKHAAILIRKSDPVTESLRAAVRLEDEGKLALAADAYRTILESHPEAVLAWTNLGNAELRLGRRRPAEDAFRKAIELDGEQADALNNLAWLLYEEKRIAEAEPLARKAVLTKAPDPWMRLDTLGRILAAKGACDEAQMTLRQALAQIPKERAERGEIEKLATAACDRNDFARAQ